MKRHKAALDEQTANNAYGKNNDIIRVGKYANAPCSTEKEVLPDVNKSSAIAESIRIVATAERIIYLNAPSKAGRPLRKAIRIKAETAVISKNSYSEKMSFVITMPIR